MHPTPKMQPRSFGPLNPPFSFIIFYHLPSTGCDSSNVTFFSPLARGFLPRSTASSNHRRVWVQLHQEEPMEAHGPFHRIHRIRVARRKARRSKPDKSIAWKIDGKWMENGSSNDDLPISETLSTTSLSKMCCCVQQI